MCVTDFCLHAFNFVVPFVEPLTNGLGLKKWDQNRGNLKENAIQHLCLYIILDLLYTPSIAMCLSVNVQIAIRNNKKSYL